VRKFKFAKLVRDKIVEDIIAHGNKPKWRTLSREEFVAELKKKMVEESTELVESPDNEVLKEISDIQEIIDALLRSLKLTKKEFKQTQENKNNERGSFNNKQYIDYVEVQDDAKEITYYQKHPDKYPEITD
jgi:predicted house-cleaning noncanonical NTP pyrophosphatase (MazG superfamily)